jgi:hypothetical protein
MPQSLFGLLYIGDVAQGGHVLRFSLRLPHRAHPVLDRETTSVLAPQHFVWKEDEFAGRDRPTNGALRFGIFASVPARVVQQVMQVLSNYFLSAVSGHLQQSVVAECRPALGVRPENTFGNRIQNGLLVWRHPNGFAPCAEICRHRYVFPIGTNRFKVEYAISAQDERIPQQGLGVVKPAGPLLKAVVRAPTADTERRMRFLGKLGIVHLILR